MACNDDSDVLTFPIDSKNIPTVKLLKQRVFKLFQVTLEFGSVFVSRHDNKQWIVLSGGADADEECQKAKDYILSVVKPDVTFTITKKMFLNHTTRDEIEKNSAAHMEEQNGFITINGNDINVAIAQSLLEQKLKEISKNGNVASTNTNGKTSGGGAVPSAGQNGLAVGCGMADQSQWRTPDRGAKNEARNHYDGNSNSSFWNLRPASSYSFKDPHLKPACASGSEDDPVMLDDLEVMHISPPPPSRNTLSRRAEQKNLKPSPTNGSTSSQAALLPTSSSSLSPSLSSESERCITQLTYLKNLGLSSGFSVTEIEEALFQFDMNDIIKPAEFHLALKQLRIINGDTFGVTNSDLAKIFSPAPVQTTSSTVSQPATASSCLSNAPHPISFASSQFHPSTPKRDFGGSRPTEANERRKDVIVISSDEDMSDSESVEAPNARSKESKEAVNARDKERVEARNARSNDKVDSSSSSSRRDERRPQYTTSSDDRRPQYTSSSDDRRSQYTRSSDDRRPQHTRSSDDDRRPQHTRSSDDDRRPQHTRSSDDDRRPQHTRSSDDDRRPQHTRSSDDRRPQHTRSSDDRRPQHTRSSDDRRPHYTNSSDDRRPQYTMSSMDDRQPSYTLSSQGPSQSGNNHGLRYIVIDGSNVAMSHGNNQIFSVRGIEVCLKYFLDRGHRATAFVPQSRLYSTNPVRIRDRHLLDKLDKEGYLKFTPARRIGGKVIASYDDRFMLNLAESEEGIIVTNDQYRDLVTEKPGYRRIIENRLLPFLFVNDHFMPPDDPLGRSGPTLEEFLRMPRSRSSRQKPPSHRPRESSQTEVMRVPMAATSQPTAAPSQKSNAGGEGRSRHETDSLFRQLSNLFPEDRQVQVIRRVLQNHPRETDVSRLSNFCLNAFIE